MPAGRPINPVRKIIKEIQTFKAFLESSLEHSDPRTLPAMQTRQREFTDKIDTLHQEYKTLLKSRAFAIFLTGNPDLQQKFAAIANEYDCYVVDANVMYSSIAKKILPSVRINDIFSIEHVLMIDDALIDVRSRLKISSMPHPSMSADLCRPITGLDALVTLVRASIEGALDTELAALYLEDLVTETAYTNEYTGSVFPVIVTGTDPIQLKDFRNRLFKAAGATKTFVIAVDSDPTPADVVLKEITDDTVVGALAEAATRFGFKIFKKAAAAEIDKPTDDVVKSEPTTENQ